MTATTTRPDGVPLEGTGTGAPTRASVAPLLGWADPNGGRAAQRASVVAYQATTVQACGLFPFTAGSGSPSAGVPFGRHMTWGEVVF